MELPAPLPRSFYDRPTDLVARELLGCLVAFRSEDPAGSGTVVRVGRIVETEAYLGVRDLACHSARGRTPRTEVMFGPPGFSYVYLIYGMHHCLNAVTRPEGEAEAVLIRALEPVANLLTDADGPGKLCRAMGISRAHNGLDLTCVESSGLIIAPGTPPRRIERGPRVGVDYAGAWAKRLLRFYESGSPFVSPANGARRGVRGRGVAQRSAPRNKRPLPSPGSESSG